MLTAFQSLGCVLFALAYLHSPFENTQTTEQGGSIALAVMNAQYKHPASASSTYSQGLRDLIDYMLQADPEKRPDIHEVSLNYHSWTRITRFDTSVPRLSRGWRQSHAPRHNVTRNMFYGFTLFMDCRRTFANSDGLFMLIRPSG